MSQDIWTQCAPRFKFTTFSGSAWRLVEGQHTIATRKLVDSDEEQGILEEIIETAKPPAPYDQDCGKYHYLLWTPFRYPPLKNGSRLGTKDRRGLWYGSMEIETTFAERAYYMLLLRSGSAADFGTFETPITAFTIRVKSKACANLTLPPFKKLEREIFSPVSYASSQPLGSALRDHGAAVICFTSARCPRRGVNIAVTNLAVFQTKTPTGSTSWFCVSGAETIEFKPNGFQTILPKHTTFKIDDFMINGRFPAPGIE